MILGSIPDFDTLIQNFFEDCMLRGMSDESIRRHRLKKRGFAGDVSSYQRVQTHRPHMKFF